MSCFASSIPVGVRLRSPFLLLALLVPLLAGGADSVRAEFPVANGALSAKSAVASAASNPATWRYTVRPGDDLSQIAADLLKPDRTWLDIVQFNKLPNARAAVPGSTLNIPVHWLKRQPQPARVKTVSGSVIRRSQLDNQPRPLQRNAVLNVGDEVRSMEGRASIQLADGSTVRLEPNSTLVFDRMTQFGKDGMVDTRLRLERGAVDTQVRPLQHDGSRFQIETPSAVAAVRGTAFRLSSGAGYSRLEVTEGQVAFGNDRQQQLVNAGFAAELSGRGAIRQMPLPPAPTLAALPANVEKLPVEISWQPLAEAASYRINLVDRESGAWLASQTTPEPSRVLSRLDNGNYTVEVAAISPAGITGRPASADFSIGLQARPALLEIPPAEAVLAEDDPLQFQWSFQGASEVAQIEIARRENFSNVIASSGWNKTNSGSLSRDLAPGTYYWRVVTEAGGSSVATSDVRALTIEGALSPPEIININYVDNQVRIFWRDVPMAQGYLLQLAQDPGFENVLKEAEIGENTAALRLAPGQRYFVRLRGLSDGPLQSSWGSGRELYVE